MLDAAGEVIYVGKARDLKKRVASYFQGGRAQDAKTHRDGRARSRGIEVTVTRTETEALMLEYNLIKQHRPRFNVVLRDDKSYPYIQLTSNHAFPRADVLPRPARRARHSCFGPYPNAGAVRETLSCCRSCSSCAPARTALREPQRPCLQYQIKRCSAPCVGLITQRTTRSDVAACGRCSSKGAATR